MWKWPGLFLRKNCLLRCWGWPSLLNWIWALILCLLLKLSPTKLICSIKFSPELVLYLYKFTIQPCMEYCWHVWAGAHSCYLELFNKLQKRIFGHSLTASLGPIAHRWNVASLSVFYRYYFRRCSIKLVQLVPLPFCRGRSAHYSDRLHGFSVTISDVTKMSVSTVFS